MPLRERVSPMDLMCPSLLVHLIRAFRERFSNVQVSIVQQNRFAANDQAARLAGQATKVHPTLRNADHAGNVGFSASIKV